MPGKKKPPQARRQLSLWQWGAICLFAGPAANLILGLAWPIEPPYTAEESGQLLGRGIAALLCAAAGVALIVVHLVRRNRMRE